MHNRLNIIYGLVISLVLCLFPGMVVYASTIVQISGGGFHSLACNQTAPCGHGD